MCIRDSLHTKSSRELASVFIDTAKNKNSSLLIETHSPDLVKQFLVELREGKIQLEDIAIYKVTRQNNETVIANVAIEDDFDVLENWEKGISI